MCCGQARPSALINHWRVPCFVLLQIGLTNYSSPPSHRPAGPLLPTKRLPNPPPVVGFPILFSDLSICSSALLIIGQASPPSSLPSPHQQSKSARDHALFSPSSLHLSRRCPHYYAFHMRAIFSVPPQQPVVFASSLNPVRPLQPFANYRRRYQLSERLFLTTIRQYDNYDNSLLTTSKFSFSSQSRLSPSAAPSTLSKVLSRKHAQNTETLHNAQTAVCDETTSHERRRI